MSQCPQCDCHLEAFAINCEKCGWSIAGFELEPDGRPSTEQSIGAPPVVNRKSDSETAVVNQRSSVKAKVIGEPKAIGKPKATSKSEATAKSQGQLCRADQSSPATVERASR